MFPVHPLMSLQIFIDIRFKNHGLDSIEVHDNGGGIAPEDYEKIGTPIFSIKLLWTITLTYAIGSSQALYL